MLARFKSFKFIVVVIVAVVAGFLLVQAPTLYAFQVPELPDDNLIVNPWFRSSADPASPGFDGWTRPLTEGLGWGLSQKESNPSPDIVISGTCEHQPVYCGTAARWAADRTGSGDPVSYPNIDVYLYQVVSADPTMRKLSFFMHWVSHRVVVADVNVYGSSSPDGPWELVWTPFFHSQDIVLVPESGEQTDLWEETGFLETTLEEGFNHYRVQLRARLPEGDGVGFKMTGVYFSVAAVDSGELPTPTSTIDRRATATPTADPGEPATPTLTPTASATTLPTTQPSPTGTATSEDLLLTATSLSSTEIRLSWQDNAANENGYVLERSPDGASGWSKISRLKPDDTSYVDSGLTPATVYHYRLKTTATDGSRTSNVATAETLGTGATPTATAPATLVPSPTRSTVTEPTVAPTTVPSPTPTVEPTMVPEPTSTAMPEPTVAPGPQDGLLLTATPLSPSTVQLSWQDDLASERGYELQRSLDGISGWVRVVRASSGTFEHLDSGLNPGTTYYYRVQTAASDGSRVSNVVSVTTLQ